MPYNSATKCAATAKTVNRSESYEKLIRCESNYSCIVITFLTRETLGRGSYTTRESRDSIG